MTAGYRSVTWRQFRDKRHQVIWRALQTLDLTKSPEERLDILIAAEGITDFDDPKGLGKKIRDVEWFIWELRAAGVLSLAGGQVYIRELVSGWDWRKSADSFAKKLKFI
jgi:hypothetical protein